MPQQPHPLTEVVRPLFTCLHIPGGSRPVLGPFIHAGSVLAPAGTRLELLEQPLSQVLGARLSLKALAYLIFLTGKSQQSFSSGKGQDESRFQQSLYFTPLPSS